MANVENINRVIAAIRNEDNFFNMGNYVVDSPMKQFLHNKGINVKVDCGTPACICGWANHLADQRIDLDSHLTAAHFLGIELWDARDLFLPPYEDFTEVYKYTRQDAIATLERFRDTGEVLW